MTLGETRWALVVVLNRVLLAEDDEILDIFVEPSEHCAKLELAEGRTAFIRTKDLLQAQLDLICCANLAP